MKVFIKPMNELVEVTRMPYTPWHEIGAGFTPKGYQVETVAGQIYEISSLHDMIFIFDSAEEMERERAQLQTYDQKTKAYHDAFDNYRRVLKLEAEEFMRALPFDKFK